MVLNSRDISATWVGIALLISKLSSAITPMPLTATVGLKLSGKAKACIAQLEAMCKRVAGEIVTSLTVAAAAALTTAAVTSTMEGRINGGGSIVSNQSQ